jgi:hypothetical protein
MPIASWLVRAFLVLWILLGLVLFLFPVWADRWGRRYERFMWKYYPWQREYRRRAAGMFAARPGAILILWRLAGLFLIAMGVAALVSLER